MPGYVKKNSLSEFCDYETDIKSRLTERTFTVYTPKRQHKDAVYNNTFDTYEINSSSVYVSGPTEVWGYVGSDFEAIATSSELNEIKTYDQAVSDGMIDFQSDE